METGWARVAAAVRAARDGQKLTQEQLGDLVGVSAGTIRAIERGTEFAKITPTLRAIERVLGWGYGSIEAIQAGGDPLPSEPPAAAHTQPPAATTDDALQGLPWRVVDALSAGKTLSASVLPLGEHTEIVFVVKGREGAPPDELRADLRRWEREQGHLRRLGEELPDGDPDVGGDTGAG